MEFAPVNLFCAHAISAKADPDLADGDHLRILTAAEIGPPLAPYAIWASHGGPDGIPRESRGGHVTMPTLPTNQSRIIGVDAPLETGSQTIIIRDADGLELARKSSAPFELTAPIIHDVEIAKPGEVLLIPAHASDFGKIGMGEPFRLAMPIEGECAWYAGGISKDEALKRVEQGAPRRLSALDRPKGPYSLIPPEAEVARIKADQAGIDDLIEALVRADGIPPAQRSRSLDEAAPGGDPDQTGEQPIAEALLFSTVDPGFARYAGSAMTLPSVAQFPERHIFLYWIVGLFAFPADVFTLDIDIPGVKTPIISGPLARPPSPDEKMLIKRLVTLTPGLDEVVERALKAGLVVRPLLTATLAYRPPDYLAAPKTQLGPATWIPAPAGPSTTFRQNFRFPSLPFAAMMAMSSSADGTTFTPRAEPVTTGAMPPATIRHNVILVGRDENGLAIASDAPIDAADQPATYRFAMADLFGRYGKSRQIKVPAPARPVPPSPQPQPSIVRAILPPGSETELSPGMLTVTVPVPAIESLGPGARPIATLMIAFRDDSRELATIFSPLAPEFALPALLPQAGGSWPLTATFVDDEGTHSATAALTIAITDARAPKAIKAAPGIIWASRPGPAPDVELNLRWPTGTAHAFRVYLSDARGLGVGDAGTRAAMAYAGCDLQQKKQLPANVRQRFRLLTDPPVPAGPGTTELSAALPRALTGVSFVKIVPLTAEGVEADFDACEFVPVAVPTDHRPPAPRLTGTVSPDGTAVALMIEATGLDMIALKAAEPGLFAIPAAGEKPPRPPEYRLRRASGAVKDPLYARLLDTGALLVIDDAPVQVTIADAGDGDGLPPFVRCTWWAEIRMPPERRLPVDVTETAVPDGIQAAFDAQMQDMPAPYSLLSTPFTTVPAPAAGPAALAEAAVTVVVANKSSFHFPIDDRTVTVTVASPPRAHAAAIGPYRLTLWIEWTGRPPELVADAPITSAPFVWSAAFPGVPVAAGVYVAVVDPLGRSSPPTAKMI